MAYISTEKKEEELHPQTPQELNLLSVMTARFTALKARRSTLDAEWYQIQKYVRPQTPRVFTNVQFNSTALRFKTDNMFDPTAAFANEQFAAGIHSYTTSSIEKWFKLGAKGKDWTKLTENQRNKIAELEDLAIYYFNLPQAQFHTTMHECNLDLGAFGTDMPYGYWNDKDKCPSYMSLPIVNCYIDEDCYGTIDTVFVDVKRYAHQLMQMKGVKLPSSVINQSRPESSYDLRYCVFPKDDQIPELDYPLPSNKKWFAVWYLVNENYIVKIDGYDEFPYFPSRFMKYAGDVNGIAPAMNALPCIKSANQIMKDYLVSGALNTRPPWFVEDESMIEPWNLDAGAILRGVPGAKPPVPIGPSGNLQYPKEILGMLQDQIKEFYYLQWLIRPSKNERQTATEVVDQRDEMLRQLSPFIARNQNERLTPLIRWSLSQLRKHKLIPEDILSAIGDLELEVNYVGPASRAQSGTKAANVTRFLQDTVPVSQVYPEAMDYVNIPQAIRVLAEARDVTQICIRTDQQAKAIGQQRAKAQQQQQMAQTMEPASNAMKNIAAANQMSGQQ